jgi:predicted O-linked N-acetylglucosamine transferase (SPINDLY family)
MNYGDTLLLLGELPQACRAFERALILNPMASKALSELILCHQYQGEISPTDLAALHQLWAERFLPKHPIPHWDLDRNPERRLRIGYLSPDFREHSVARFLEPLLKAHDPRQVELHAYSVSSQKDATTQRMRAQVLNFHEAALLTDDALTERIRADRVDILVELGGHSSEGRLGVVARHAAPIQIFWLGYPGTTGVEAFFGRFTDVLVDPEGEPSFGPERPLRLPGGFHCFRPDPDAPGPSAPPMLTRRGPTFASFNALRKHTPQVLETWAALLRQLPDARLLIKTQGLGDPMVRERIHRSFAEAGVNPGRVELNAFSPDSAEHLARYNQADVALDTFPYNGVTTTCEALWMGLPVVTLYGDRPAGRECASLLTQAGHPEWIAQNQGEYVEIAKALVADPAKLAHQRLRQRGELESTPLLDAPRFSRAVEAAYRHAWREWCAR